MHLCFSFLGARTVARTGAQADPAVGLITECESRIDGLFRCFCLLQCKVFAAVYRGKKQYSLPGGIIFQKHLQCDIGDAFAILERGKDVLNKNANTHVIKGRAVRLA